MPEHWQLKVVIEPAGRLGSNRVGRAGVIRPLDLRSISEPV